MATTKSFTTRKQSKVLAKILPLESADMHYSKDFDGSWFVDLGEYTSVKIPKYVGNIEKHLLPCWSLAALYGVLPNNKKESTTLSRGGWKIVTPEYIDNWWCEYEDDSHTKDFTVSADNPVDAVFEMICWLKENNKL